MSARAERRRAEREGRRCYRCSRAAMPGGLWCRSCVQLAKANSKKSDYPSRPQPTAEYVVALMEWCGLIERTHDA